MALQTKVPTVRQSMMMPESTKPPFPRLQLKLLVGCSTLLAFHAGCSLAEKISPLAPLEKSLVYQPRKLESSPQRLPELGIEDVLFRSSDGTQLNGWFVDHPNPTAVALWMHGNAGNIASRLGSLQLLNERHRLAVMVFDYRGYGRSDGAPSEKGLLQDARAARQWLAARKQIAETDIVLMGRSLGGGIAVDLAANDGARGLVLASTFTSLPDVGRSIVPWLPTRLLMTQRLNSLSKIAKYHGPLLQSHGDADRVIPFALGEKLFAAANEPKRFIRIEGGDHNDPQPESYRQALDEFLNSLPPIDSLTRLDNPATAPSTLVNQ